VQFSGRDATDLSSLSISSTFSGQKWAHIPHPLHQSLLMMISFNFGFTMQMPFQIETFEVVMLVHNFLWLPRFKDY